MKTVPRLAGLPRELATVQENLANATDRLSAVAISNGRMVRDVVLATGGIDNVLEHKLGRQILGWFPVRKSADCRIWDTQADERFLKLRTSATATVSLWVF